MRWVTKFNLGIKQVLIQKLGPALEQEQSEVSKKGPASADGREAERRGGRKRNGCCLSEASFIHFPPAAKRSSPDGAALTFWFFWVKPKERNIPIGCQAKRTESSRVKPKERIHSNPKARNDSHGVKVSTCQSVKIENGWINLGQKNVFLQAEQ